MGTPVNLLYLPKSARAYLFPQSVKFITSAAAPLVLTPFVRNQGDLERTKGAHTAAGQSLTHSSPAFLDKYCRRKQMRP